MPQPLAPNHHTGAWKDFNRDAIECLMRAESFRDVPWRIGPRRSIGLRSRDRCENAPRRQDDQRLQQREGSHLG